MSESNEQPSQGPESWWSARSLLTPQAAATTAFTLAVLSLMGQGAWTLAIQAFLDPFSGPPFLDVLAATGFGSLLIAVAAVLLGRRVLTTSSTGATWQDHLARAAVLLGALGGLLALVTFLLALLRGF